VSFGICGLFASLEENMFSLKTKWKKRD